MQAMVLRAARSPLVLEQRPVPQPGPGEVLLEVRACAVCRTDLHIVDGELSEPKLPLIPGHQIVGRVAAVGSGGSRLRVGQRVGVPWLGRTCGSCRFCRSARENLCERADFTGYTRDGGFATHALAAEPFVFPLPEGGALDDSELAPLLCGGLIGYRALRMAGAAQRLGLYGFGNAAHILAQVARHQGQEVYAFTRRGDEEAARLARSLGAAWVGASDEVPPVALDAAILFAPVGQLVPAALAAVDKGGVVVCAGIHMSDIPSFPYRLLWEERQVRSVANLTREDGERFLPLALAIPVRTQVTRFPLAEANEALSALRHGQAGGAVVLDIGR